MHRYIGALLLVLVVACTDSAIAELPKSMTPGASEQLVRSSLKLEKCTKRAVDPSLTDCDEVSGEFQGRDVTVKVIFHSEKLAFAYIYFEASEFDSLIPLISKTMGRSRNSRDFDIVGLPRQQAIYWGNENLFVNLKSAAFGDLKRCLLVLQLPEFAPSNIHPLFLVSMDGKK